MKSSKILGAALILVGIGLLGYWIDCSFWHPTAEDLRIRAAQEEYGVLALHNDPKKILFSRRGCDWRGRRLIQEMNVEILRSDNNRNCQIRIAPAYQFW